MIDEIRSQLTIRALKEDRLPVVGVVCANIEKPREPEIGAVANSPEAIAGQDFQNSPILPAQELGTEAQA